MFNIILFGITSLLADLSSEMVFPILPFFIQSLGGAGVAIGLVFGIGDAVAALFKVGSGYFADKTKKYKSLIFAGYLFSALAKLGYPLANQWQQVLAVRPIERIGKGVRDAPRDAVLSESLPLGQRGKGFGIQRAMDSVGAIAGSILVLILFFYFALPFKRIFLISAFIALLAVIPILLVRVPEKLEVSKKLVSFKKLSPEIRKFIAVATLFSLAHFSYAFFILKAQSSFSGLGVKTALGLALLLYVFLSVFDSGFSTFAGRLSDKIGRQKVILASYAMLSFVFLGFLLVSNFLHGNKIIFLVFLGLFALYGLFRAFADVSQKAFVSDLSDVEIRGTALGTFETFTGLAAIPAGLIAGLLWNINSSYAFAYGFVLALIATIVFAKMN